MDDDLLGARGTQLFEDGDGPVPAPIIDQPQLGSRVRVEKCQEGGARQAALLVVAGNNYADFRHTTKCESPGNRMPPFANHNVTRPSSVSSVVIARVVVSPRFQVASPVESLAGD